VKAFKGLQIEIDAVHRLFIAHDICKHLETQFFVEQKLAISVSGILILLGQKVEELPCLGFSDSIGNEYSEHILDV